jgi:hypothetical protein
MANEQDTGNVDTTQGNETETTQASDDASAVAEAVNDATQNTTAQDDAKAVAEAVNADVPNEAEWMFAEGVAGEGEIPEWFKSNKYKTVAEQAKAYKELESKFGSFTGSPEEFEPAELSEELKEMGIEINQDDPLVEKALAFAKETNMNQEGFNQMINLYAETVAAENMAIEAIKDEQMKALGNSAESRINNLNAWANANLSEDMIPGFQSLGQTADGIKTLERLVAMTRSAPLSNDSAEPAPTGATAEEVREMQFALDDNGNRKIAVDPEYRKRYEKLRDRVYGVEDHRVTIG